MKRRELLQGTCAVALLAAPAAKAFASTVPVVSYGQSNAKRGDDGLWGHETIHYDDYGYADRYITKAERDDFLQSLDEMSSQIRQLRGTSGSPIWDN